jgi:two-component system response regulator YesN
MLKIAIVDDDRIIRRWLTKSVPWEEAGCQLSGVAADGEQGLQLIEKSHPNIVISDIKMPFLNGIEMAQIAKKKYPETEFILLTGFDDVSHINESAKLKVLDYILKPVDKETLLAKVKQVAAKLQQKDSFTDYAC